jgi:large subunit ribosomal protein L32
MAVPKYRTSRSKVRMRRNHWRKMDPVPSTDCAHCHEPKLPHRVCPHCGFYNGMEIVAQKHAAAE